MWVQFEWDEQGWANFVSDPEVPPILKEAGHLGKPDTAALLGRGPGKSSLIFCTGPVPAQQLDPFIPWLMKEAGARRFYVPSADYIWPHVMNKRVRDIVRSRGGEIAGEEYFPLDHTEYTQVVADIMASGAEVVFNTIVPPGLTPFLAQLHDAGFAARGGQLVCTYFDENFLNLVPAEHVEGLYGCLDYYRGVRDPFSVELLNHYDARYPGSAMFTAGSAWSGTYRALKLWEAAASEAGSLDQDEVIAALDHASISEGPGGPAEMGPGQHHVRMDMYIARSETGAFKVVENLGCIDPWSAPHIVVEGDPPRAALVAAVGSYDQLVPRWCCRRSPRWPPMAAFRPVKAMDSWLV